MNGLCAPSGAREYAGRSLAGVEGSKTLAEHRGELQQRSSTRLRPRTSLRYSPRVSAYGGTQFMKFHGKYRDDLRPTAWQNFRWTVADWLGRNMGWICFWVFFALFLSVTYDAEAEELYIEAWVEEVAPEGERCYAPYSPDLIKEFENNNVAITVRWYDSVDELREALMDKFGEIWDDRQIQAASDCDKQPEFNISYCDIFLVRPTMVDDDTTMSLGHEVLHGLLGAYHD